METGDTLLTQLPARETLAAIDDAADRQLIERYQEAHDQAWVRGEKFDYPPEYSAAHGRIGARMREKIEAARANGTYDATPVGVETLNRILEQGRQRMNDRHARLKREREEWLRDHPEQRATEPSSYKASNEERGEELRPPEAPANPEPATPENVNLDVQRPPTTMKEVNAMIREVRRKTGGWMGDF